MAKYSNIEYADMHLCYGKADGVATTAAVLYTTKFGNRRSPSDKTIQDVDRRLREYGCFTKPFQQKALQRSTNDEDAVLNIMQQYNGKVSVRTISAVTGIPPTTVWRILKSDILKAWHPTKVQQLTEEDHERREMFAIWVMNNRDNLQKILFTDESLFGKEGILNLHNIYEWAEENPHSVLPTHFQSRVTVNVWLGVIGQHLVGPHFFEEMLTGQIYHDFLRNDLPELMDNVPYVVKQNMYYQHDGAAPHRSQVVTEYLNETFPDHWIGNNSSIAWPPTSPDLSALDFSIWAQP